MSVVLPAEKVRRTVPGSSETEGGLCDDAGQPGAVRPPPPADGEEGQLHTEHGLSRQLRKKY